MKLDHIEKIEILPGITPLSNYHSILHLKEGIFMTYNSMKDLQDNYYQLAYPDMSLENIEIHKKSTLSMNGQLNRADSIGMNLIHWYSINLINYAKSCGLVNFLNYTGAQPERFVNDKSLINELRDFQKEYLSSIQELDPVIHFRNKASAHLAYTDPKNDNAGTLVESMSLIPTFEFGKITIGGMQRVKGKSVSSFSDYKWNLVDNFESLIPRYFINDFG